MGKDKLKRFEEMKSFPNVYQCYSYKIPELIDYQDNKVELKGKWQENHFKNKLPITLELACGKGEYTVGLAQRFPEKNFIGVDIKGARIHKGAKDSLAFGVENAAFLRTKVELLPVFFAENEISELWITFTDPFPKDRHEKHRLTAPNFLEMYRKVCIPGAIINLKHDDEDFFNYTLEVLEQEKIKPLIVERDIHEKGSQFPYLTEIVTHYEKMHLKKGKKINYLQFKL